MPDRPSDKDDFSKKYPFRKYKTPVPEEELGDMHLATENYSVALEYFEKALNKIHKNPSPADLIRLYLKISDCYRKKGLLDEAWTFLKSAQTHCDESDRIAAGSIASRAGIILYDRGDVKKALKEGCKAYKLLRDTSEHHEVAHAQLLIANCYARLGQNNEAEQYFLDALSSYRRIGDHVGESYVMNNLGLFHKNACRWGRALDYLNKANELGKSLGLTVHRVRVLLNLGIVHFKKRDFIEAQSDFVLAKKMARRSGDEMKYVRSNLMLGRVQAVLGNYPAAERHLLEARVLAERRGYAREIALADEYIGDLIMSKGGVDEAMENYSTALIEAKRISPRGDIVAEVLRRVVDVYLAKKIYGEAIAVGNNAVDVINENGELHELGFVQRSMGLAYFGLHDVDRALDLLQKSSITFKSLNNKYEANVSMLRTAEVLYQSGSKEALVKARKIAGEASSFFEESEEFGDLAEGHFLLSKIQKELGSRDESLLHIFEAQRLAEDLKLKNLKRKIKRLRRSLEEDLASHSKGKAVEEAPISLETIITDESEFKLFIGESLEELMGKLSDGHCFIALFGKDGPGRVVTIARHNISDSSSNKIARWFLEHGLAEVGDKFLVTDTPHDRRIAEIREQLPEEGMPVYFQVLGMDRASPLGVIFYQSIAPVGNTVPQLAKEIDLISTYAGFFGFLIRSNLTNASNAQTSSKKESLLDAFHKVITRNDAMLRVLGLAEKVAGSDATVLLMGETGTGKSLIARAIHNLSPRRNAKFVHVNCAALPESILESELFGHVKGSFTGAVVDKKGLLAEADGGTIFLDEIGKTSLPLQGKLLQFLDTRQVRPVGSNEYFEVDVRLIFASKVDLLGLCKEGRMLEDFYYRVNDFPLRVPPLRERVEDIHVLAEYYLKRFNKELGKGIRGFSDEALSILTSYNWPGNVRELEKLVKRAVILASDGGLISADDVSFDTLNGNAIGKARVKGLAGRMKDLEKRIISESLIRNGWNKSIASKELGISYPTLLKKIKEYDLTKGY